MRPITALTTETATEVTLESLLQLRRFVSLKAPPSSGQSSGQGKLALRTRGMRFEEVRPYTAGDDVRVIDWRVTARTQKTHTKVYRDDNETHHVIAINLSSSMDFATQGRYKSVIAAQVAALLGWSFVQHRDKVALMVFDDKKVHFLESVASVEGWTQQIKTLLEAKSNRTQLSKNFDAQWVAKAPRHRQYTIITSAQNIMTHFSEYKTLAINRSLHFIIIVDPLEMRMPQVGWLPFLYNAMTSILMTNKHAVVTHQQQFNEMRQKIDSWASASKVLCSWCTTEDDPLTIYTQWMQTHGQRR